MYKLVLLRHGQSQWNLENRFTGWADVPLTERGINEAIKAGQQMKEADLGFDMVHSNVLKRAIKTTWLALEQLDLMWIPVFKTWKLNERHYGALQGLNKAETAEKYGEEQVKIWRRSYSELPPLLTEDDDRYPGKNPLYQNLNKSDLPLGESLETTLARVLPYWQENIVPQINTGKRLLISASGNSIRAIIKHLDKVSNEEIVELTIPTGFPLVYELDENLNPIKHYFLVSDDEIQVAINEVENQGKK
jgi:2,3-bisphosphoglycerate-dependent phosphoglycerate mutase